MSQPILLAVAAMACYGLSDFIYKQAATAGLPPHHFMMVQGWFFAPLVTAYALTTGTLVVTPAAAWGALAGAFIFVGFYLFARSLAAGAVSTNASIFRMNFLVTVLLVVVVLGEPLGAGKIAGAALAALATWLLIGGAPGAARAPGTAQGRSLAAVLLATLAFGASHFFHTVALRQGALPETLVVAQAALFMPLGTATVYFREGRLRPPPVAFRYAVATALALLVATICLLRGIARGEASVLVPIAQMGFIIAALLGVVVLRERLTWRKAAGLAVALAALAVLAIS